jgi:hypothetical protein
MPGSDLTDRSVSRFTSRTRSDGQLSVGPPAVRGPTDRSDGFEHVQKLLSGPSEVNRQRTSPRSVGRS